METGFHSAARWLDLCCEVMQLLIVANCGYYFCDLFIKIECIQLFFDVSMVIV